MCLTEPKNTTAHPRAANKRHTARRGIILLCAMQTMDPLIAAELRRTRIALSSVIGTKPIAKPPRQVRR